MKNLTLLLLGLFLATTACKKGNAGGESTDSTASTGNTPSQPVAQECPATTELTVEGANFSERPFKVVKAYRVSSGPRNFSVELHNWESTRRVGRNTENLADTQAVITIDLNLYRSPATTTLGPGTFLYHNEADTMVYKAMVKLHNKGSNAQNMWTMGQENPITVELFQVSNNRICGRIQANQTVPDQSRYTPFKISGNFAIDLE